MKKIIDFFLSLKLTVVLLSLSMVLVLAGTLAQVDLGIWEVMEQYFRCYIAQIDLFVFFPRNWDIPRDIWIPFPGGFLIGLLLTLNLVTVHAASFKILTQGRRRLAGILVLLLGIFVVVGVIFGWGTASVAVTEDDAFWRVFFRLGRGTIAAVILFIACQLLYRQRAGMVLLHAGILFLLVGEFCTALFAVESTMTIVENESINYVDRDRSFELAFTDSTDPEQTVETVIPGNLLREKPLVEYEELPFDIKVRRFMPNSTVPVRLAQMRESSLSTYPEYEGVGSVYYVVETPKVGGTQINFPAVDVELIDRASGESLGRYIFSLWFYPNASQRQLDAPTHIDAGGRHYDVYFRQEREYLQSPDGNFYSIRLLDFNQENYEGTQMPKDYSSHIRLVNEGEGIDRELRIWMNNPLRYARRTFYQSGFLPGGTGTVLQVVRNDVWMIPYLSCMIVLVGMIAQFSLSFKRYLRRDA